MAEGQKERKSFIFHKRNRTSLSSLDIFPSSRISIRWRNRSGLIFLYCDHRASTQVAIRFFTVLSMPTWARAAWRESFVFSIGVLRGLYGGNITTWEIFLGNFFGGWFQSISFLYFDTVTWFFHSNIAKTASRIVLRISFDFASRVDHFSSGPSKCFGARIFHIQPS